MRKQKMVMVKRIRKSDSEIWTIAAKGELNGKTVYGPAVKLENLNPDNLSRHLKELAPYIVIQWLYSMITINHDNAEVIACRFTTLICEFTKFTPRDFDSSGNCFLTNIESLCTKTLPYIKSDKYLLPTYPSDIAVELKSQNGDIYKLQTTWSDIKQTLEICNLIK